MGSSVRNKRYRIAICDTILTCCDTFRVLYRNKLRHTFDAIYVVIKLSLSGLIPTTVGYKTSKTASKSDHPFRRN